jgi:hypothetical protein
MADGDVLRLTVVGRTTFFTDLVNVFHYRQVGADGASALPVAEEVIAAFINDVESAYLGTFGGDSNIVVYKSRVVVGSPAEFQQAAGDLSGFRTGDSLPQGDSAEVLWKTGVPGRRFQGKNHLWPTTEGSQANGVWSGGYLAQIQTYVDAALNIQAGAVLRSVFELVVRSKTYNLTTPVTSAIIVSAVRHMNKRTPGFGS